MSNLINDKAMPLPCDTKKISLKMPMKIPMKIPMMTHNSLSLLSNCQKVTSKESMKPVLQKNIKPHQISKSMCTTKSNTSTTSDDTSTTSDDTSTTSDDTSTTSDDISTDSSVINTKLKVPVVKEKHQIKRNRSEKARNTPKIKEENISEDMCIGQKERVKGTVEENIFDWLVRLNLIKHAQLALIDINDKLAAMNELNNPTVIRPPRPPNVSAPSLSNALLEQKYKKSNKKMKKEELIGWSKAIANIDLQINKINCLYKMKDDNKQVSLATSKTNYIDPRIIATWGKKYKVPLNQLFNATLQKKFPWALDLEEFDF